MGRIPDYKLPRDITSPEDGAAALVSEIFDRRYEPCTRCFLSQCTYEAAHTTEQRHCVVFRVIKKAMEMEAAGKNVATTYDLSLLRWPVQ